MDENIRPLTPIQQAVYRAFWEAVWRDEDCGAQALSRVVGRSRASVDSALRSLRNREKHQYGWIPSRLHGSHSIPPEWREMAPAVFRGSDREIPPETQVALPGPASAPPTSAPSSPQTDFPQALLAFLQRKKDQVYTLVEVSDALDCSPRRARQAAEALLEQGYNVYLEESHVGLTREEDAGRSQVPVQGSTIRFGVVSDTHLGSKYERLDVLSALYEWYAQEGVTQVYHAGNTIEGCSHFNVRERHKHGLDEQVDYFIEQYPQKKGITTYYIGADDHEGWFQKEAGMSVGRYIQTQAERAGRNDLQYLGFLEHDVEFSNAAGHFVMRIMHPGGGSAYAVSYIPQKIVESLTGGEKPAVLIIGHYHKMEYLVTRGVRVIQAGCTVDQGVWARKKRLAYHLGGWLIELVQCPQTGACIGCQLEDRVFFDKGFYQQWER